jgi:predicted glycosyltransferase
LEVQAGNFTRLATKFHRKLYEKYDEIWIPDFENKPYFSGRLGHPEKLPRQAKYIGILSRFTKAMHTVKKNIDLLIVLSGPEKQRTLLENELIRRHLMFEEKTVLVRGTDKPLTVKPTANWQIINFANSLTLQNLFYRSKKVILRSGYSSIMDLVALRQNAVLIPTPGQYEQEYLAAYLQKQNYFPSIRQNAINKIVAIRWDKYFIPEVNTNPDFDFKIFEQ